MMAAESIFSLSTPELSYWWSGLRDDDDDGLWVWAPTNTPTNYTDWHPAAVPEVEEEETIKDHVHHGDPLLHIELHIFQSLVEGEGVAPKIV